MCVCVCVCVYIYICVCVYECVCVCVCMYACVCVCPHRVWRSCTGALLKHRHATGFSLRVEMVQEKWFRRAQLLPDERKRLACPPPPWRQSRAKWMVSLVNSHTNTTSMRWYLWEIDLKFALDSTPGRLQMKAAEAVSGAWCECVGP